MTTLETRLSPRLIRLIPVPLLTVALSRRHEKTIKEARIMTSNAQTFDSAKPIVIRIENKVLDRKPWHTSLTELSEEGEKRDNVFGFEPDDPGWI